MSIRVCKLGGSLLDEPNLSVRWQMWLAQQVPMRNVIVVGGGPEVASIRQRWNAGLIDDLAAHWEAIQEMSVNAKIIQHSIPNSLFCERTEEFEKTAESAQKNRTVFLDVLLYLQTADCDFPEGRLPASWDVTSDSIAARVAKFIRANELVLWKSTSPPKPTTISNAQAAQFVDSYFNVAAEGLENIRWVNLRNDAREEGWLQTG